MKPDFSASRIAVLGIGNHLNGDDAAGMLVVAGLKKKLRKPPFVLDQETGWYRRAPDGPAILPVDGGPAPENATGPLVRFRPEVVFLVDAAELGEPPGSVAWVDWQDAAGFGASTHTLSPTMLARYLSEVTGCRTVLVGIQPAHLDFDRPVSEEVKKAARRVVKELYRIINQAHGG